MERKRSRMSIIYDMLSIILKKRGRIKPTHLMYGANLSHKQMKIYLDDMLRSGLVEFVSNEDRRMIMITKKGNDFFSGYGQLREFESTFGL